MTAQTMDAAHRPSVEREYYDVPTIIFHWLTVVFVLALMGTALVWNYWTPHDRFWRPLMESSHVSLGILFAALILARVIWRWTSGHRIARERDLSGILSRIMYSGLYVLLVLEAALGFVLRWLQGEDFQFFGFFSVPALIGQDRALAGLALEAHNWTAWAIIVLSFGHAAAALVHHYVLKDQVLQRMVYRRGSS
jgi:cytochrome b561